MWNPLKNKIDNEYRKQLKFSNYNIKNIEPHINWYKSSYLLAVLVGLIMVILVLLSIGVGQNSGQHVNIDSMLTIILVIVTVLYTFSTFYQIISGEMNRVKSNQAILAPESDGDDLVIRNFGNGPAFNVEINIKSADESARLEMPTISSGEKVSFCLEELINKKECQNNPKRKTRCLYFVFEFSDKNHYVIEYSRYIAERQFVDKNNNEILQYSGSTSKSDQSGH